MNNLDTIKTLIDRLGKAKTMPELTTILNEYEAAMNAAVMQNEAYLPKLRRLREEIQDLRRIKFDAVLKGRINDGLRAFRKQVDELEAPPAAANDAIPDPSHAMTEVKIGEGEEPRKPFRNMPSLGMD
jgi:hypothetical protein